MMIVRRALLCALAIVGVAAGTGVRAETGTATKPVVAGPASAPQPVRVVSANPASGQDACQSAVWPNVPAHCLKPADGAAVPAKPVRVVGSQDDLRTNPGAAKDAGQPAKKLRRLPAER